MKAVGAVVITILLLAVLYLGTIVVAQNKKIGAYEQHGSQAFEYMLYNGKVR